MSQLNERDLSLLHTHLMVPIAVGDIIYNNLPVDDEAQYALHEALSEIDPDSALLAIAISAKHIALQGVQDSPTAGALSIEAGKIIDEYGPEWLSNYKKTPINEDALLSMLRHVPEDLESLAELLDILHASWAANKEPMAKLCRILSIQAKAHMEIADFILTELESDEGETSLAADIMGTPTPSGDNIILFPIHLRH